LGFFDFQNPEQNYFSAVFYRANANQTVIIVNIRVLRTLDASLNSAWQRKISRHDKKSLLNWRALQNAEKEEN